MKGFDDFSQTAEGCWPTPEQTLLLRAALLDGDDAVAAWQAWRERAVFDEAGGAAYRLMPLVHQKLSGALAGDPLVPRLKGLYRHTWSRNQLLFHAVAPVLRALAAAEVPTLLIKGSGLVALHYRDAGLRPMGDFDCLVPWPKVTQAFEVIAACGWRYAESVPLERLVWCTHAAKFRNATGQELDLHWNLLPEGRQPNVDEHVWSQAVPVELAGVNTRTMSATDLLWHICAHGVVGDPTPAIRWIPDVWALLRQPAAIDWTELLATTRRRGLTLSVGRALWFARREFAAPVPEEILTALRNTRRSWLERAEYRIKSRPRGLCGALPLHLANYLRLAAGKSWRRKLADLPWFFQRVWGLPGWRDLPGYALRKTGERVRLQWANRPRAVGGESK